MPTGTAIRYRWVGGDPRDGHINGIPAGDLTDSAYEALDEEQRKVVQASPLYETTHHRSRSRPTTSDDAAADEVQAKDDASPDSIEVTIRSESDKSAP